MHDISALPPRNKSATEFKTCAKCGGGFVPRKPWQEFCSSRCRLQAFRHEARHAFHSPGATQQDTGAGEIIAVRPSPIQEVPVNTHAFHPQNQHLRAPRHVIEAEVFGGREWRQVVSPDGVVCQVGTLRQRALRNGGAS
jgi:hypothetical protein